MAPTNVDYSLYLVTDSTAAILGDRDLVEVVQAAVGGGVTLVQYRDKVSDTAVLVSTAKRLHAVTQKHKIPLLINDRIDVALAVGCEGVHIGQDDLDLPSARKLLGRDAIIGVTVSSVEEAQKACKDGADYLGLEQKKILQAIADTGRDVRTVSIGGINASTVQRVLYQSSHPKKKLDGVAIVSAIIAARDPKQAAKDLLSLVKSPPPFAAASLANTQKATDIGTLLEKAPTIIREVGSKTPLSHNMTNLVVQNFAANVALAVGGSPIMANYGEEASDLCKLGGALVINMGTVTPDGLQNYALALKAYNLEGGPVVLDPVGGGATAIRRAAVKTLLAAGYFDVIKGNEGEIKTVFGTVVQQKGVDSGVSTLSDLEKATLVRDLAARERNVVVMTGATDFVSDGLRTYAIKNGHELLGRITGSGCVLGTTISLMLAVCREDKLLAAVAGLLHYEIAAEIAAEREDVKGPGTFVPALIDELYNVQKSTSGGDLSWLKGAKVEAVDI
ncbi:putative thiamine biosynthetic bifunctional enzyme [Lachnellula subtilissima]|uniref:Putative thiamine biosynthetic bifunctional enzyme n=1 Tax=Lachnellula subtilissima TaxID=602034 RepID=A0A8H8RAY2_9HELO|nr:putative thiamine biosynthetic bifunctional enzyme [Lachnellula subtilissima]